MISIENMPHGNLTILKLKGDIDLDGATKLKEKIQEVRKSGALIILLNFAEVSTVRSSVLHHLVAPIKAITLISGVVAVCNMSDSVHKFIKTSMFYSMLEIFESEEDAVEKFAAQKKD